jgi:hypothetical protein
MAAKGTKVAPTLSPIEAPTAQPCIPSEEATGVAGHKKKQLL